MKPVTVIVNTWFEPTGLFAVAGVIEMNAFTHFFSAFGSLWPAAVSFTTVPVVRVNTPPPTGISEDACTTEVPVVCDVIVTMHDEELTGIAVDPESMFDVQVKRMHEYKRQLLNILHVIHRYWQIIEDGVMPIQPRTFFFAGKRRRAISWPS